VEVDIKTQNGAMSAEMVVSQTQWEGEESFLASFRDITSRKRLEEVLKESLQKVRETLVETIKAMAYLVETRDPYTAGHQQRVALLADEIAKVLNLPEDQRYGLYLAALIHDIGKISIPAEILTKPSKLTDIEMKLMQGHPQTGYDILKNIPFPWPIATIVLEHHERLDGSGYPLGKSDGEILLESQILAVADVVEAMASHRPYRPALGVEPALLEIDSKKGVKYNPQVVEACIEIVREGRVKIG
jgi:HD-GYP domain-containing protein (c-di-GMP phosphodiesterase class II)